jgi:membrane fusion protein, copper/silver efflux system
VSRALIALFFVLVASGAYWVGKRQAPQPIEQAVAAPEAPAAATPASGERKPLYYRNPMGAPDTSPVPKKDSMGMDYIPVYADEVDDGNTVKVSMDKIQRAGVRIADVETRSLVRQIRAVGSVQFDERRLTVVSTKYEGWIEQLLVDSTGTMVKRGQPLARVYSPELVVAQQEYAALKGNLGQAHRDHSGTIEGLADGALQRLRNLDVPAAEIARLQREAKPSRLVTLHSPFNGIVTEKMAFAGARFMPGDPLYRIADTSTMWLIAEIYEQDLAAVRIGQEAQVSVQAYPGRAFTGRVTFIYPTVGRATRTARVRLELANKDDALKADMYAEVAIGAGADAQVTAVPDSAVIDDGSRQYVLVDKGEGRFEPRPVKLGAKADGFYEVKEGLAAGDRVVVGALFLIDAESNLRAALKAFTAPEAPK